MWMEEGRNVRRCSRRCKDINVTEGLNSGCRRYKRQVGPSKRCHRTRSKQRGGIPSGLRQKNNERMYRHSKNGKLKETVNRGTLRGHPSLSRFLRCILCRWIYCRRSDEFWIHVAWSSVSRYKHLRRDLHQKEFNSTGNQMLIPVRMDNILSLNYENVLLIKCENVYWLWVCYLQFSFVGIHNVLRTTRWLGKAWDLWSKRRRQEPINYLYM